MDCGGGKGFKWTREGGEKKISAGVDRYEGVECKWIRVGGGEKDFRSRGPLRRCRV